MTQGEIPAKRKQKRANTVPQFTILYNVTKFV